MDSRWRRASPGATSSSRAPIQGQGGFTCSESVLAFEAVYAIDTLEILRGQLPRRAHGMVIEWALAHRAELRTNWERAREQLPLEKIEPLD